MQFIIDQENIEMTLNDQEDIVNSMVINKSENNQIFYDYIKYMTENRKISNEKGEEYEE